MGERRCVYLKREMNASGQMETRAFEPPPCFLTFSLECCDLVIVILLLGP